ncbi:MAG TPA: SIR2 family protein, partial [Thermoanaerobaculia bacterium]
MQADEYSGILQQINKGYAVLFLGAGSTRACRRPDGTRGATGDELAQELLTALNGGADPGIRGVGLMQASEFYTSIDPAARAGLDRLIQDRLGDLRPTVGHYLAASFRWRAVVTTNYNRVAEDAWSEAHSGTYAANELLAIKTDQDIVQHQGDTKRLRLYKAHGCVTVQKQQDNRMVLTSNDYFASERIRKNIYDAIRSLARECSTVFAGYSLADYTFKNIFYTLYEELGQWASRSYTVAPIENPIYEQWLARSMSENFKTTVINASFDEFMMRLAIRRGVIAKNLKAKVLQ